MHAGELDPTNIDTLHSLRTLAEAAARAGGDTARRLFGTPHAVRLKPDHSEVSEADEAAQEAVISCLRTQRPDDAILAEEVTPAATTAPPPANETLCWVIDPIDGTRNYIRGVPLYACSVAAMIDGEPIVGAIYAPTLDVLYSANCSGPLYVNNQPQPTPTTDSSPPAGRNPRPVVATPSTPTPAFRPLMQKWLERFVCRNLGTTALQLALVAGGNLDGLLTDNPRLWDLAAGYVLIQAAGARMTTPTGRPIFPLDIAKYAGEELPTIAAKPAVYKELLSR